MNYVGSEIGAVTGRNNKYENIRRVIKSNHYLIFIFERSILSYFHKLNNQKKLYQTSEVNELFVHFTRYQQLSYWWQNNKEIYFFIFIGINFQTNPSLRPVLLQVVSGIGKLYPEPGLNGKPGNYSVLVEAEDRGFPANSASAVFLVCVQVGRRWHCTLNAAVMW